MISRSRSNGSRHRDQCLILTLTLIIISIQCVQSVDRLRSNASYEFKSRTTTRVPATLTWYPKTRLASDQHTSTPRANDDIIVTESTTERVLTTSAFESAPKFKFHGDKTSVSPLPHSREARYYLHNLSHKWNSSTSVSQNFVLHQRPIKLKRHRRSASPDYDQQQEELIKQDDFIIGRPKLDARRGAVQESSSQEDGEMPQDQVGSASHDYKMHSPLIKRVEIGQKPSILENGPFIEVPVRRPQPISHAQVPNFNGQQPMESQRHEIFNGNSHGYGSQSQSQEIPGSKVLGGGPYGTVAMGVDDRRQFESLLFNNQRREFEEAEEPFVPKADPSQLQNNMYQLFSSERNDLTNITFKNQIRQGIIDRFLDAGLQTWTHSFSAVEMTMLDLPLLDGINIIGVMPGKNRGQPNDGVVLIGAHYDTVQGSPGVNDNGSGMAMLLEIARLLKMNRCKLTHSVMFVAFDLEEYGGVGSRHFIHEYLIPYELMNGKSHFQGAFILDTLLNFAPQLGSQDIPNDIYQNLPEWGNSIRRQGFVGDFVAMISRKEIDSRLSNHLKAGWVRAAASFSGLSQNAKSEVSSAGTLTWPPYKLSDVAAKTLPATMPTVEILGSHANLLRSDHVMFWYHNSSDYKQTLNAILLTDTGPYRGYMRRCYHSPCDSSLALSKPNMGFMKFTTEAVATTVIDLTYTFCSGPEAVTGAQSSSLIATTSSNFLILILGCLAMGMVS